ncbi:MAG: sensor histidine kinase [Bacteroidota bacterium]
MIAFFILFQLTTVPADSDTTKIDKLLGQAWELKYSEPEKSLLMADSAIHLSDKIKNAKRQAHSRYYKAIVFYLQNQYDSALLVVEPSFEYYSVENNDYGIASLYNLRGLIYERKGWYEKAIEQYISSQKYAAKTENLISQANPLHNLGLLYADMESHVKALEYFKRSLVIRKQIGDTTFLIQSYQSVGTAFMNLMENDSALFFLQKSFELVSNTENEFDKADILNSLGLVYLQLDEARKAKSFFKKCIELSQTLDYGEGIIRGKINIALTMMKLDEIKDALPLAKDALKKAKKMNLKKEELEAVSTLTQVYAAAGNFKLAYNSLSEQLVQTDSLMGIERTRQIEELKSIYETEKKEQEISYLNQENELKNASLERNTFLIIGLVILLILLLLIFYFLWYRARQKHKQVLNEQKIRMRESQIKAVIDSQETERKRFAEDLHDGMGQLVAALQLNIKSLKANENDIEEKNEIFEHSTQLLAEVHQEIRNIAFNLMPQTLIKKGLDAGLRELVQKLNKNDQIKIHFTSLDVSEDIDDIIEISLYRISQEFLSNILKHSNAKNIYLDITGHNGEMVLSIEDDGQGYDLDKFQRSEGNGWRNINTRVSLINGEIDINTSVKSKGSNVILAVPLKAIQTDTSLA